MKRFQLPGLLDIALSDDAEEVESLAQDPKLDRAYTDRSLLLNRLVLRRVCATLQVGGRPLPTVASRDANGREAAQSALWDRLGAMCPRLMTGPDELESLARHVRGEGSAQACGPLVQEVVGQLFQPGYKATSASWDAALVLNKAPRTMNPLLLAWWAATGRVGRAKRLLSEMVEGDLAGVHATGIALHNIVSGLERMRQMFRDKQTRESIFPEAVASQCLFAPASVLRQPVLPTASAKGELRTRTLLVLKLQAAHATSSDKDVVFLRRSWAQCPAERWVPALLEGTWRRAAGSPMGDGSPQNEKVCPFPHPASLT